MNNAVERLLDIARAEIGYHEKATNANLDRHTAPNDGPGNYTKYARDLAREGYYQASKQGYDWCDMFCDWCFLQLCGSKERAERVQCQTGPYGAGCGWSARYFEAQGRLFYKDPQPGDQIFFDDYAHTGLIEDVRGSTIHTIEGNSSNQVIRRQYHIDSDHVTSFGRPRWDLVPAPPMAVPPFIDVPAGEYYTDAVRWGVENKVVEGVDDIHFAPNDPCTRAQAATMIWRMQGSPEPEGVYKPFADVLPSEYFAKAVQWAADQGVTYGTGGNRFSPNDPCSRAEIITMIHRLAGSPDCASNDFADLGQDDYCLIAANWGLQRGVVKGTKPGTFAPNDHCTRGMIITMLYRYAQL